MHNLIQAMDLNDYNSQLCRFNNEMEKKDMMSLVEQYRGLQVGTLGDKYENYYKDRSKVLEEVARTKPSTLEVVEYESTKHDHLPDYARAMIEMIEEAEYEMLHDYITSKDEWHRDVRIEEDGTETITWIHKSELVDDALRDYEKFLVDGSILLEEEKGVELPWEGETIALGKMFNLSVGDCK